MWRDTSLAMKIKSAAQGWNIQTADGVYVPERFSKAVDAHLLGNMLDVEHFPLILAVVGPPGMGKTFQLRKYLKRVGISVFSISAANLESVNAGEPTKMLQEQYILAANAVEKSKPSALLIDDIDTTLGEWENHTGTVNHQDILAFLMHIADNPYEIENFGAVRRIPIFFTGNYIDRLYAPLMREGRAARFEWTPNYEEKVKIVASIFSFSDTRLAESLVKAYPNEKVSFFSDWMIRKNMETLTKIAADVSFPTILTSSGYKEQLKRQYLEARKSLPWEELILAEAKNAAGSAK